MRSRIPFFAFVALVCLGCGKSNKDVINEYRPKIDARRETLAQINRKLPAAGVGVDSGRLKLNPLPVFDNKGRQFNAAVLSVEQLADADAKPAYDLIISGPLLDCLLWTGPKNPMASSALSASAGKDFTRQFEDALDCRYLVIYRTLDHKPPVVLSEKNYQAGTLTLEVFLADMESKEVLSAFRVSARSAPVIEYTFKEGEDRIRAAEGWAQSSLTTDARKQLAQALAERTGGTFVFDP
jgi:hypothetical protein